MKHLGSPTIVGALGIVLSLSTTSGAEPTPISQPKGQSGYSYTFVDDPLAAGGIDVHDARIRVAIHAMRTTLIRPRSAFVAELLKTVENL